MWRAFHHPDISLPVVRRRIGLELLDMLEILGDTVAHGAHSFLSNRSYPDRRAFHRAVSRLSKQGLLIQHNGLKTPILSISQEGRNALDIRLRPDRWWRKKWNGIWYMIVFDVPESDRSYRNALRQFLTMQRMGCFQKSVWVTPHDIRPEYNDLREAAAIDSFACLFETQTVLGMSSDRIVDQAWDLDRLFTIQKRFCDVYQKNLEFLCQTETAETETLMAWAAEEIDAYRSAFALDPLLPNDLLPDDYKGKQVYNLHKSITKLISTLLRKSNPD